MTSAEKPTEHLTASERDRTSPPVRVRDAATLIVLDRSGPAVLMGRRSARHVFMPNFFVFPGGRCDPADSRVRPCAPYDAATAAKLKAMVGAGVGDARARALGVAAIREAYEETGILIGKPGAAPPAGAAWTAFASRGLGLDLSALRFFARATTPPGRPRRYDTRFFVASREAIADVDESRVGEDAELEEIRWVEIAEAKTMKLPRITVTVLDELTQRLAMDPSLKADAPVPYYRWTKDRFARILL